MGEHQAQLAVAAGLAVVLTQIIFVSHDAAHQQILTSHRANEIAALIMGTGIAGVSLGWWFFPLLVVEMLNLHVQSVQALLTRPDLKRRRTELALIAVRLLGYPQLVLWLLPLGLAAAFVAVQGA